MFIAYCTLYFLVDSIICCTCTKLLRNSVQRDQWEMFFRKVSNQRLRIRSQNLAAEVGHKMRDLGMDAQLAIFAHLRPGKNTECVKGFALLTF